jgi:hypothetical protein
MLKTDLIKIVNGKNTWGFIGSGISNSAGYPSWGELLNLCLKDGDAKSLEPLYSDKYFQQSMRDGNYPKCFSLIENIIGREKLENIIRDAFNKPVISDRLVKLVVDWPFKCIITTNYDGLIEQALKQAGQSGWISIGNSPEELKKISGDASRIIWHIHGGLNLESAKSNLIITEKDYDDMYLCEPSPAVEHLKSLIWSHRIIIMGYGFHDPEVNRVLKRVSRYASPAKPAYAFFGNDTEQSNESERRDLLKNYNIDTISYRVINKSHARLLDIISVYSSMIIRNSLKFEIDSRPCPSYDAETTGLLIYNSLCLKKGTQPTGDIASMLLKARMLALLYYGKNNIAEILDDLSSKAQLLNKGSAISETDIMSKITSMIKELLDNNLINKESDKIYLTNQGKALISSHVSKSGLLSEQFSLSLLARASSLLSEQKIAGKVAKTTESFIKDCIDRRSLGVAMALSARRQDIQNYHIVALLQNLPDFISRLDDQEQALAMIKIIQDIFAQPNEAEERYIGIALQAKFGVHILGCDQDTLKLRVSEFMGTLFLIDSSTIIPYLAYSSTGYDFARFLIKRIQALNSCIGTTKLLSTEVAEHARWAVNNYKPEGGALGVTTLEAMTGVAGLKDNAFLDGFQKALTSGESTADLNQYMSKSINAPIRGRIDDDLICKSLENDHINCIDFDEWDGFDPIMYNERDMQQEKIKKLRVGKNSYKHDRQVKAEAEALIIINNLRDKIFKIKDKEIKNAYFISHTRIIDEIDKTSSSHITMRPEMVLQWIMTLMPAEMNEIKLLTHNMLGELLEFNYKIIDLNQIGLIYGPLLDASKEKLNELCIQHRDLIAQRYGENAEAAFLETNQVYLPIILQSVMAQQLDVLQKKVEESEKARRTAEESAKVSAKDKILISRIKAKKEERKRRQAAYRKKKKH